MVPGTHGSTYGGNPLACAVGNAVLDRMLAPGFIDHVDKMGQQPGLAPAAAGAALSRLRPRTARQGPARRHQDRPAGARFRRAAARRPSPARRGRGRERAAPAAAADRHRGRHRGGRSARSPRPSRRIERRGRRRSQAPTAADRARHARQDTADDRPAQDIFSISTISHADELRGMLDLAGRAQDAPQGRRPAAAAQGQGPGDDLRAPVDPHPRLASTSACASSAARP